MAAVGASSWPSSGASAPDDGTVAFGPRTSVGLFTQINDRPDFLGRQCLDIVRERVFDDEKSMKSLARYGLRTAARQEFQTLSGGQKARLSEGKTREIDANTEILRFFALHP